MASRAVCRLNLPVFSQVSSLGNWPTRILWINSTIPRAHPHFALIAAIPRDTMSAHPSPSPTVSLGLYAMSGSHLPGDEPITSRKRPRISGLYHRKRAVAACQPCRVRKTKCDNIKPSCGFCTRSAAQCTYADTASDHSSYVSDGECSQAHLGHNWQHTLANHIPYTDSILRAWPSWNVSDTSYPS